MKKLNFTWTTHLSRWFTQQKAWKGHVYFRCPVVKSVYIYIMLSIFKRFSECYWLISILYKWNPALCHLNILFVLNITWVSATLFSAGAKTSRHSYHQCTSLTFNPLLTVLKYPYSNPTHFKLYLAGLHFNENSVRTSTRTAGELQFQIEFLKCDTIINK